MTLLATLEDFMRIRGESNPVIEDAEEVQRARLALEIASDLVRNYTGRGFDRVEATVYVDGSGSESLLLPNPPVVDVVSVHTLDSNGDEDEVALEDFRLDSSAGILRRIDGSYWPRGWLNVGVELVSGYRLPGEAETSGELVGPLPKDLQGAVLSVAGRLYDAGVTAGATAGTSGTVTAVTMGVYSETFKVSDEVIAAAQSESGLTKLEESAVERYRLVRVG